MSTDSRKRKFSQVTNENEGTPAAKKSKLEISESPRTPLALIDNKPHVTSPIPCKSAIAASKLLQGMSFVLGADLSPPTRAYVKESIQQNGGTITECENESTYTVTCNTSKQKSKKVFPSFFTSLVFANI